MMIEIFVGVAFVTLMTLMSTLSSSHYEDPEHMALVRPIDVHDATMVFGYSSKQPPTIMANHLSRDNTSTSKGSLHQQGNSCRKNDRPKRPGDVNKRKKKMRNRNCKKNMNIGNKVYLDTIN